MKNWVLGYLFVAVVISNVGFASSIDKEKIGFKGVFLGQSSEEACKIIQEKFPNEDYKYLNKDDKDELGRFITFTDQCKTKSISIYLDDEKKVESISYRHSAFGIEKMSLQKFAQLILDNAKWLPKLDYNDVKYQKYYYIDNVKLGFSIVISDLFGVTLKKEKIIVNRPNFN
ncbi:hypothetical protein [Aliarcobacter cryaerophilus]|uniref:hypothetical protein n=1 Tax=Aliarcobacter cryaerophilus TaxID=28198 RepID=UPI0021B17385|nr:hypothetical protein [Aliarcobacter cryaerophilus]MCT7512797.1 hypothetical protein [Aliarcobacter cryaerophilus]